MPRTTIEDLENMAERVESATGRAHRISATAQGKRLERLEEGTAESHVSPRLPSGGLALWIRAYLKGLRDGS